MSLRRHYAWMIDLRQQHCATEFGPRLKEERKAKGLTQEQVADFCGCSPALYSRIERGDKPFLDLTAAQLVGLATVLGLHPKVLFAWPLFKHLSHPPEAAPDSGAVAVEVASPPPGADPGSAPSGDSIF